MRRVVIRAPSCGADIITHLKVGFDSMPRSFNPASK